MPDLREYVKSVKSIIDVKSIINDLGIKINRHGMARCIAPEHEDKNPSLWVGKDACGCYACGFHADCFEILQIIKGFSFMESLNFCADYAGIERFQFGKQSQEDIQQYQAKKDRENNFYKLMDDTVRIYQANENPYLEQREISKENIRALKIGSTNGDKYFLKKELLKKGYKLDSFAPLLLNSHGQDFFQNCTIIPIFKSNRCILIYGRKNDGSENYKHLYLKKNGFIELGIDPETTLFYFDQAKKYRTIYIFESIIDCLSGLSNGIKNATSIYGTQGLKDEHMKQMKNAGIEDVYLVMDGDQAGRKAAIKNGYKIEDAGINATVVLMPKKTDPNAYFRNGGTKESFDKLPQCSPLQLEIQRINQNLIGKKFVSSISSILDRIVIQDPLTWNHGLKTIKDHFKAENPSINDLKASLKKRVAEKEFEEKKKEKNLIPIISNQSIGTSLTEIFNDPDLSQLVIPADFLLTEKGISSIVTKGDECYELPIAHAPCIIRSMSSNIDNGTEFRELAFKQNGKIKSINVPREVICDQKKMIELSALDFPVNSINAKYLVKYLADFEATNRSKLPQKSVTHGFGHRFDSKGNLAFFLPQKTYGTDETLTFEGKGPGDLDYFHSLNPKGKLKDWVQIIKNHCLPHNVVMFNLFAGFSVPLLKKFNIHKSFIINYSRKTSTGKTTNNEIVASIFGDPAKLILQWQFITHVGLEQLAGLFNGIPIFLDDAQNADKKKVSEIVYIITHGLGKMRGHKTGGLQKVPHWNTELFSTSEENIQEESKKEGAEARAWDFSVLPFGSEDDKEMGEIVRTIKKGVHETYGVAISPFLDYSYNLEDKNKLLSYYDDAYKVFNLKSTKGGKAHRQIENWAAVLASGFLVEEVFHFGSNPLQICSEVFDLYQQEGFSDPIQEAMDDFISWANSNDERYDISGTLYENKERSYGERHGVKNPGEYIAVFPHLLKEFLVKQGYSYKTILKGWKDRGWIKISPQNFTIKVGFRGKHVRMVKIYWKSYSQD